MDDAHDHEEHRTATTPGREGAAASSPWVWLGLVLLAVVAWRLFDVLLLVFGASLLALALARLSAPLHRRWGLPARGALAIVILGALLVFVGAFWLAGASAAEQLQVLRDILPRSWQTLQEWLRSHALGLWLLDLWSTFSLSDHWSSLAGLATGTFNATAGVLGGAVLLLVLGIYLAADPGPYRFGLLRLVPPGRRLLAERTLDAVGRDLSRWLLGQAVSMLAVGLLTAALLALIGMPLVLTLSLIAGLVEFVPYFGPLISGVLIVAVALTEGERMAWLAVAACFAVQQCEAYLVQPLVQRWAVRLLPVLSLLAVLIFGLLFGLAGVLLAVPLMVFTMTLVDQLYLRAMLKEGESPGPPERPVWGLPLRHDRLSRDSHLKKGVHHGHTDP